MKSLQYIFYRLYLIQSNGSNSSIAEFMACLQLTFLILLNFITILDLIYVIFGKGVSLPKLSMLEGIILVSVPITLLYYFFGRKNKMENLKNIYKEESEEEKRKGKRIAIMYWVLTPVFLAVSLILMILKNRGDL